MRRFVTAFVSLALTSLASADDSLVKAQLPTYPFETCVVSDEPLEEAVDVVHEGRLVRLCCKGCKRAFGKDPDSFVRKVDAAVVRAQKPAYPLTTCAQCEAPLKDAAVDVVHGMRLARVCGEGCVAALESAPTAAMRKLDEAYIRAQRPGYTLKTCIVSDKPLKAPKDVLYGTQLVRLCCNGCKREFANHPAEYAAAVREALAKPAANDEAPATREEPIQRPAGTQGGRGG